MLFSKEYVDYVTKTANQKYTVEMAACALMEEMIEFDNVVIEDDMIDELGDVYYQFVLFAYLTGANLETIEYDDSLRDSMQCILAITSQLKKRTTRGKELNYNDIDKYLSFIYSDIIEMTQQANLDIKNVEQYNMKKLNERYGVNV